MQIFADGNPLTVVDGKRGSIHSCWRTTPVQQVPLKRNDDQLRDRFYITMGPSAMTVDHATRRAFASHHTPDIGLRILRMLP